MYSFECSFFIIVSKDLLADVACIVNILWKLDFIKDRFYAALVETKVNPLSLEEFKICIKQYMNFQFYHLSFTFL